jgi:WD40 repeat protein
LRGNSVGIFPLIESPPNPIKVINTPILLNHGKNIQDFELCPYNPNLIATLTKQDNLIRIWNIPSKILPTNEHSIEIDAANIYLAAHEKRIDICKFHPTTKGILVSAAQDNFAKLWDIETISDKITLNLPGTATSIEFDFDGYILLLILEIRFVLAQQTHHGICTILAQPIQRSLLNSDVIILLKVM